MTDPGFLAAEAACDAYGLYAILEKTHRLSGRRQPHLWLQKVVTEPQGSRTYSEFVALTDPLYIGILAAFSDPAQPGYIKADKFFSGYPSYVDRS